MTPSVCSRVSCETLSARRRSVCSPKFSTPTDGASERDVPRMARTLSNDMGAQAPSEQRQVADEITHLVPEELIFESEPTLIHDAVLPDYHRVVQRGTQREAARVERLGVGLEAKRARWREIRLKGRLIDEE